MNIKDISQLRRNGYAVDAEGRIETHKTPQARWDFSHLAMIRIDIGSDSKIAKEFIAKVVAADCIEPGAIVGVGRAGAVMIFKAAGALNVDSYPHFRREMREEFVLGDKDALFVATDKAELVDVAAYTWRDGRSPLTTRRDELPTLFLDNSTAVFETIKGLLPQHAGRVGPLVQPETALERIVRENAERGIAATPIDEDAELVAGADPNLQAGDGIFPMLIAEARKRIARKAAAEKST